MLNNYYYYSGNNCIISILKLNGLVMYYEIIRILKGKKLRGDFNS